MPQRIDVPGMGIVEFPDGMNDDAIAAAIKSNMGAQPSKTEDIAKSGGIGVVKGGIGLLGLPGDLAELGARGIDRATQYIGGKVGVDVEPRKDRAPDYGSADIRKSVESRTGEFYKPKTTAGEYAQTVGEFAPGLIGTGGLGALGRRALTQVIAPGVASEAAGQATKGTAAEPYARVVAALAGGVGPSMVARAVTPNPSSAARQRLVEVLNQEGVTSLTAGQRTGSKPLQYMESFLGDAPGAGGGASRIQQEGQRQFTEAAMRRAGAGPDAAPEVLANNQTRLKQQFEDLSSRNAVNADPQLATEIGQTLREYDKVLPAAQKQIVGNLATDIVDKFTTGGGMMAGKDYQAARSRLSRMANNARVNDPDFSEALRGLRNSLDNAMDRSIPFGSADKELWQKTRKEYGAQKTIEKAASRAGEATAEGQLVPANLRNAVATGNNRGAYARGEGVFSELARAGSGVMAPLPNSGTAQRLNLWGILNDATLGAIPAAAGRAITSRPAQAYLGNQAATRLLEGLSPQRAAIVNALLASTQDRAPLRIAVNPNSRSNP